MLTIWLHIKKLVLKRLVEQAHRRYQRLTDELIITEIRLGTLEVYDAKKMGAPVIKDAQLVPDTRLWN